MSLLQSGAKVMARRMPKFIGPKTHAMIDYAMVATFFAIGALYWGRHKRAALGSMICGTAIAANSLFTDYPGGVWRAMSYETHGRIDAGLAGMTAMMPRVMAFSDDSESRFFELQALAETAVTAMTDFTATEQVGSAGWGRAA